MKSYFICIVALQFLAGCAGSVAVGPRGSQDQNGGRAGAQKCIGGSFDRDFCAQMANRRCGSGFEVFEMDAKEEDGVARRAYYFKCLP